MVRLCIHDQSSLTHQSRLLPQQAGIVVAVSNRCTDELLLTCMVHSNDWLMTQRWAQSSIQPCVIDQLTCHLPTWSVAVHKPRLWATEYIHYFVMHVHCTTQQNLLSSYALFWMYGEPWTPRCLQPQRAQYCNGMHSPDDKHLTMQCTKRCHGI